MRHKKEFKIDVYRPAHSKSWASVVVSHLATGIWRAQGDVLIVSKAEREMIKEISEELDARGTEGEPAKDL